MTEKELRAKVVSIAEKYLGCKESNGSHRKIIDLYGHGTGTGGWVAGRDYINPAIRPIFDQIANDAWKEVTKT